MAWLEWWGLREDAPGYGQKERVMGLAGDLGDKGTRNSFPKVLKEGQAVQEPR